MRYIYFWSASTAKSICPGVCPDCEHLDLRDYTS